MQQPLQHLLLGAGRVGEKHLKAIVNNADRYQLVGIIDPNLESIQRLKLLLPIEQQAQVASYASLDEALRQEKADSIALCSPSGLHYEQAKQALEHGLHCLIEKPMTLCLKEARELLELARHKNLQIAVGYLYRYFPFVEDLRQQIAGGEWGRLIGANLRAYWGHDEAYYQSAAWRGQWLSDGGALMNQCVHAIDLILYLCGARLLQTQASLYQVRHQIQAEDTGHVSFLLQKLTGLQERFPFQLYGTTASDHSDPSADFSLLFEHGRLDLGIRGKMPYLNFKHPQGKWLWPRLLKQLFKQVKARGVSKALHDFKNPHSGLYLDFAQAIAEQRSARADGEAGYASLEGILSAYASAKKGGLAVQTPLVDFDLNWMQGFFSSKEEGTHQARERDADQNAKRTDEHL